MLKAGGITCGRGPADDADAWILARHAMPVWIATDDLVAIDEEHWRVTRSTAVHTDANAASSRLADLPEGTVCSGRPLAGSRWLRVPALAQPAFLHPAMAERCDFSPLLVDTVARWSTLQSPAATPRFPLRPGWPGADSAEGMLLDVWRISQAQRQALEVLDALGRAIAAQPRPAALAALRTAAGATAAFHADAAHCSDARAHCAVSALLVQLGEPADASAALSWCQEMDRRLDLGGEMVFSLGMDVASPFLPERQRATLRAPPMLGALVTIEDRDPVACDALLAAATTSPLGLRQAWWSLARADRPGISELLLAARPTKPIQRWQLFAITIERACRLLHPEPLLARARAMASAEPDTRMRNDMADLLDRLPQHLLARCGEPSALPTPGF